MWKAFCDAFNCFPACAVVDEKIMCTHGGLSPEINNFDQVRKVVRPTDVPDSGIICDLLWADPEKGEQGWCENDRGVSSIFGADVVQRFLRKHDLDLVCRAHQVVEDGYEFFAKRQLVTLFFAPNYCGEFDNAGALMTIDVLDVFLQGAEVREEEVRQGLAFCSVFGSQRNLATKLVLKAGFKKQQKKLAANYPFPLRISLRN